MADTADAREDVSEVSLDEPETTTHNFRLPVDENNKATVLRVWNFSRPHMRAFHFAWFSFFLAFFGWFALSPLLVDIGTFSPEIQIDKTNNKSNRNTSNIVAVMGTILMRFAIGPFADTYGPRTAQCVLLSVFSIPVFLVGTAQNFAMFTTARFFIGFIGATFVVTQYWTSIMFAPAIVGVANATSAGWGNLGGGVTNILMPQISNLMKAIGANDNLAWRVAQLIPATALLVTGILLYLFSDDLPEGNYRDLIRAGTKTKTNPFYAFGKAAANWRSWLLFLQYAACFGVELVMNGNLATVMNEQFEQEKGRAGLIAGLFGLMNLFARSMGGILSDFMAKRWAMRGRLWAFWIVLFLEGLMIVAFSRTCCNIGAAIPVLILFSITVQMSEGATFGIVPFVDPPVTGAVSGIVGAGGNFGAVTFGLLFRLPDPFDSILYLGFGVIAISMTVPLLWWPQFGSMLFKPSTTLKTLEDEEESEEEEESVEGTAEAVAA